MCEAFELKVNDNTTLRLSGIARMQARASISTNKSMTILDFCPAGSPECKRELQFQTKVDDNITFLFSEIARAQARASIPTNINDNITLLSSGIARMQARASILMKSQRQYNSSVQRDRQSASEKLQCRPKVDDKTTLLSSGIARMQARSFNSNQKSQR